MAKTVRDKISDKLVNAFLKNKIISPIPSKFTKKLTEADKFRKLCESKIKDPIIGFKAGGTGIPLMKKLKEKEPFVASVFSRNFIKSGERLELDVPQHIDTSATGDPPSQANNPNLGNFLASNIAVIRDGSSSGVLELTEFI